MANPLAMSDDDIMNMTSPPLTDSGEREDETNATVVTDSGSADQENTVETSVVDDAPVETEAEAAANAVEEEKNVNDDDFLNQQQPEKIAAEKSATDGTVEKKSDTVQTSETDYKGFYEKVMVPFKANGKMISLKSPDEAIQLMQMGANYTRKMQELQPHKKMLLMLQNNNLLDEEKLSYLIDLDKKEPSAIKKLVKDSGIDPMDIDTSEESTYLAGNHSVTDDEANFRSVLDELSSNPEGKQTLQLINGGWDQASKEVLWKSPELMTTIHQQREAGIYGIIVEEMDRQKTFGKLPPNTPFLEAYRIVGDMVQAAGGFNKPIKNTGPIETRAAAPKSTLKNGEKASAALTSRSTPKTAKILVNPLSMSDDEFLKQMENRL